jgi:HK97 family phage portal protein
MEPDEIIHIRDNSARSIYRGDSRLRAALQSINVINSMASYQLNLFENSAITGLVILAEDMLSDKIKERKINEWVRDYNPRRGGKRPIILDGNMKVANISSSATFKELEFTESMKLHEEKILETIGIPPVLFNSGNNANISPNLKMFYLNTVLPLFRKFMVALEVYFGYDLKENRQDILALRPELKDEANYLATLTNSGILTRNEVREDLRRPARPESFAGELILPANIAGSALNANTGGRPPNSQEEN